MPGRIEVWSIVPRTLTSRVGWPAVAVASLALVAGGLLYVTSGTDVTLTVDGATTKVTDAPGTVNALLAARGVDISERDLVIPAAATRLEDGARVVVRHARPFTISENGRSRVYWTTEQTVGAALEVLGIHADATRMPVSRSTRIGPGGLTLDLASPVEVDLVVAGSRRTVVTASRTVGEFLTEQGLQLGPGEQVSPAVGRSLTEGMDVTVSRVRTTRVTERESIAFTTTRTKTDELPSGRTRVVTKGRDGVREVVYQVVSVGGREIARSVVSSSVRRKPVTRVLQVGTGSSGSSSSPSWNRSTGSSGSSSRRSTGGDDRASGSADSLNWSALARCESGGNPRAVSPNGRYHGLYQFSVPTWRGVGGSGLPSRASAGEQTARAKILYRRAGAGSWPSCGRLLFS
ncbi:MAG: DUF348 domain-containing protein [Actinomycetales bacterium]|nr:DUF348 domain-containing protein [Actinomycetales bacterium]